jgi:abortive infection bacteriophage resistance protein
MLQQRYQLELDLKDCFFPYLSLIESGFKNLLCYHTCHKLGNEWRTNKANITNTKTLKFLTPMIDSCNAYRSGNTRQVERKYFAIIKNYYNKFTTPQYPPFRNIMDLLTFGDIGHLYRAVNDKRIKARIATTYQLNIHQLELLIKEAVQIRNIVYHDNHLLFYKTSIQGLGFMQTVIDMVKKSLPAIKYQGFIYAVAMLYVVLFPS